MGRKAGAAGSTGVPGHERAILLNILRPLAAPVVFIDTTNRSMEQESSELARGAGEALRQARWRLATAESCTGGLIGHAITEVAGSSEYYQGGVVAYDNAVKREVLGVAPATLERWGAVSEPCAREMAEGIRRLLGTELGVATTGIAGPGGGTPEKPVGLVYIAVTFAGDTYCERHIFQGDRHAIKQETARRALELVIDAARRAAK